VAKGGAGNALIRGPLVQLEDSRLEVLGGAGGDAGDGGSPVNAIDAGAGGGGYTGGRGTYDNDIAHWGGKVSGNVGRGGGVSASIVAREYFQKSSVVSLVGGDGGDAGAGGDGGSVAGGGGGGYSGGGGGNQLSMPGANGGGVSGDVGSGGDAVLDLDASWPSKMFDSQLTVRGGDGGNAGDGGSALSLGPGAVRGGAGGGGYSGGGGGGAGTGDSLTRGSDGGGGGTLTQRVAHGGAAQAQLTVPDISILTSTLVAQGGEGGAGGVAGGSARGVGIEDWLVGGGGGSYSSGGGGGAGVIHQAFASGEGGPGGIVRGQVGDGGRASMAINSTNGTITSSSNIESVPGPGGTCWASSGEGAVGGSGTGRITGKGTGFHDIPMSKPILIRPENGITSSDIPLFSWYVPHPSSAHGEVLAFEFVMDDDVDFSSPEMQMVVTDDAIRPAWISNFTSYWHVRALYSRPFRVEGPWSDVRSYSHINLPPEIGVIPLVEIMYSEVLKVDLSPYIIDPDDKQTNLSIHTEDVHVVGRSRLNLTLFFKEDEGVYSVNFTVTDHLNTVEGKLFVQVIRYRHPPYILGLTNHKPPLQLRLWEGTNAWYEILVHDVDSDRFTYSTLGSWSGAKVYANGTLHVQAPRGDVGFHDFKVKVTDEGGRDAVMDVVVEVLNVNDPPDRPTISSPSERITVTEGDVVYFQASVYDPDLRFGQLLNLTFVSNSTGVLKTFQTSTLGSFSEGNLPVGVHRITVVVSDGQYSATDGVTVVVQATPEPPPVTPASSEGVPLWVYFATSLVLFAVGIAIGDVQRRRTVVDDEEGDTGVV
jgi:hypothetical protein